MCHKELKSIFYLKMVILGQPVHTAHCLEGQRDYTAREDLTQAVEISEII